jgi:hypothetical protein
MYCNKTTNKFVKEVAVFLLMHFWIYPNMFRQVVAIIRGSWLPQTLLKRLYEHLLDISHLINKCSVQRSRYTL